VIAKAFAASQSSFHRTIIPASLVEEDVLCDGFARNPGFRRPGRKEDAVACDDDDYDYRDSDGREREHCILVDRLEIEGR
jgi:hypothetical protein